MRKIYTSLFALAAGSMAFAQANHNLPFESVSKSTSVRFENTTEAKVTSLQQKAVMYSEDFEAVTAPALPAGMTTTGCAMGYWYTGDEIDANLGTYWPVPNNGSTNFAMINDDADDQDKTEEMLILPTQDFTGQTGMTLKFSAFHDQNYGTGDAMVRVSTDGGTNWTDVLTLAVDAANWQNEVVNLSAYDGMSSVTIAFWWNDGGLCGSTTDTNWGTGLAIDNIVIENAPADEIAASWLLPADIATDYTYTMLPLGQTRPLGATMRVANQGTNSQTDIGFDYDISLGGSSEATGSATPLAINAFGADTISTVSSYTPSATGTYTITGTVTMGATDTDNTNNEASADIEVTDLVWARDFGTFDGGFYNVSSQTNGEGVKIGHLLLATADQDFTSIHIGLVNSTAHDGQLMFGELWYYDGNSASWVFLESTDDHTINNTAEGGTIIELPLLSTVSVTAGMELLVVAGHYGGAPDASDHVRFATAGVTQEGSVLGFTADGSAFQLLSPPSPVVRLEAAAADANVEENGLNVSVGQNYPNPFNGNTTVNYTLENADEVTVEITDLTGKVIAVMNEGVKSAGNHVVQINSNRLAAGTYYYSIVTSNGKVTKAMNVAK